MSKKMKHPTKNEVKKKRILILSSAAAIAVVILVSIIVGIATNSTKSYDEVSGILYKASYDIFYSFDNNYYDKKGNCYTATFSEERDCRRDVGANEATLINIYAIKNGGDNQIWGTFDIDSGSVYSIDIYKKDTSKNKYGEFLTYTIMKNEAENSVRYLGDESCYIGKKPESSWYDECEEENLVIASDYIEEAMGQLSDLGLSARDLFSYFGTYAEKYAIPKYEEAKKSLEKTLSYQDALKYIEAADYDIIKMYGAVSIYDYTDDDYYDQINFYPSDGGEQNSMNMLYTRGSQKGYSLMYLSEYGYYLGQDESSTCWYIVDYLDNDISLEKGEMTGKNCSQDDREEIESLYFWYKTNVKQMGLTQSELLKFASEYYSKN